MNSEGLRNIEIDSIYENEASEWFHFQNVRTRGINFVYILLYLYLCGVYY